jgi:hypothetical protein
MTKKPPGLSSYFSAMGKKGGRSRAEKLTAAERTEIARKGGEARQAKAKQQQKAK